MNTKKVLKKLNKIGCFKKIEIVVDQEISATFKYEINDIIIRKISEKFPSSKYNYSIKKNENDLILNIKDILGPFSPLRAWFHDPLFISGHFSSRAGRKF
ncbi:hypothetical protein SAMN05421847_2156 [Halpernia humi]|uniref:Uncharacterized protein n=1 Tax=Halpernia humi TaxID=493375 RepID=A0A1H5ZSM6_9FLAO|nr:hypothetical protein [Halpernia humi]SEG38785.1 hypothetical protein SAMN05421847_2156 [Halpernia humi]